MPRVARKAPGGLVYHVLNRANGRLRLFKKAEDYTAFEKVLAEAHQRTQKKGPRKRVISQIAIMAEIFIAASRGWVSTLPRRTHPLPRRPAGGVSIQFAAGWAKIRVALGSRMGRIR